MRKWAVRVRYLSAKDDKWHRHTTKWYSESELAWFMADKFTSQKDVLESSCSLIHKEVK